MKREFISYGESQPGSELLIVRNKSLQSGAGGTPCRLQAVEIGLVGFEILGDCVEGICGGAICWSGAKNMLARRQHELHFFTWVQRGRFFSVYVQMLIPAAAGDSVIPYEYRTGIVCQRQCVWAEYAFHRY